VLTRYKSRFKLSDQQVAAAYPEHFGRLLPTARRVRYQERSQHRGVREPQGVTRLFLPGGPGLLCCKCDSVIEGLKVKTTVRGGTRGFDAHKRVKVRKRHILVDTLGLLVANRVEPADTSDRRAPGLLNVALPR